MRKQEIIIRDERIRERVINLIRELNLTKPFEVTIGVYRKKRSNSQNSLYWKWIAILADHHGYTKDEMHETFKQMLLPKKEVVLGDKEIMVSMSTADKAFTTEMMAEYMDQIAAYAAGEGILLPSPED